MTLDKAEELLNCITNLIDAKINRALVEHKEYWHNGTGIGYNDEADRATEKLAALLAELVTEDDLTNHG